MMRKYVVPVLVVLFFSGCKSEFQAFNEQVLTFAKPDKRIDKKEILNLVAMAESDERAFRQFKSSAGRIDHAKLNTYLQKYCKAKDLPSVDIWTPEPTTANEKFNINVFLENSKSMDGYVKKGSEFTRHTFDLLADFKISNLTDSLNLFYINEVIPYSLKDASNQDITDFIKNLDPVKFAEKGGNRSVSNLRDILENVLAGVDERNLTVLISDFVFSPGGDSDADKFLDNQRTGIELVFAKRLKTFDLSVVIIQLESVFQGIYYNKMDADIKIDCKRPYYICLMGSTRQIGRILNGRLLDNIKGGYKNRLVFQSIKNETITPCQILYRPRIGDFKADKLAQHIITDARPSDDDSNKGRFGFNVAVNFAESLQDPGYFLDPAHYKLSNKSYRLQIDPITGGNPSLPGFTHQLQLQTNALRQEVLKIDVIGKAPAWVYSSTSADDTDIKSNNSEKQKTYGFSYLIEGIKDAFYPNSGGNILNSISITIKK